MNVIQECLTIRFSLFIQVDLDSNVLLGSLTLWHEILDSSDANEWTWKKNWVMKIHIL